MRRPLSAGDAGACGQASVELVALVPVLVAAALAVLQVLAAGLASELAGHAAEAGAVALLQGGAPERAARDALPGWSRGGLAVQVRGGVVRVRLEPPVIVPPLARALAATATADAGAAGSGGA